MTATSSPTPVLQARGLVKRYGQVTAIDGADFDLLPGEVLAVIGDNGAGKTSLIKALTGAVTPDAGEIRLNGEPITFSGPQSARAHGIETVYQDLAVAASMDIASNMFLGRELRRPGVLGSVFRMLDKKRMRQEAAEHMADLKIGLRSLTQSVETLSGGQRQAVAVARSVAWARSVVVDTVRPPPPWRQGVRPGPRPHPPGPRQGHAGRPDQPQHAPRLRDRRPDPRPPPRPARCRDQALRLLHGRGRRHHDRRSHRRCGRRYCRSGFRGREGRRVQAT